MYFGEIGFFSRQKRIATVESVSFSSVSILSIEDFVKVINYVKDNKFKVKNNTI